MNTRPFLGAAGAAAAAGGAGLGDAAAGAATYDINKVFLRHLKTVQKPNDFLFESAGFL